MVTTNLLGLRYTMHIAVVQELGMRCPHQKYHTRRSSW